MKHESATPSAILRPENQCFQIPPFQRNYSWTPERIQKLIFDIAIAATQPSKHWIGIMLTGLAPQSGKCANRSFGHQCYIILDGQQRVLTIRLILLAISDEIKRQTGESPEEIDRDAIASINVHGLDQEDWAHIARGETALHMEHGIDNKGKLRIRDAYLYIRWVLLSGADAIAEEEPIFPPIPSDGPLITQWANEGGEPLRPPDLLALAENILTKLELSLLIHEDSDEPVEVIFESLNGLRTELGQYDLFRNFLLTQANVQGEEQRNLYTELMQEPEQKIDRARLDFKEEKGNLQVFLSDFVLLRPGLDSAKLRLITRHNSANKFKEWWQGEGPPPLRAFIQSDLSSKMRCWLAASSGVPTILHSSGEVLSLPKAAVRSIWRIEMFSRGTYTPLTTLALEAWLGSQDSDRNEVLTGVLHSIETVLAREVLSGESNRNRRTRMMDALPRGAGSRLSETTAWMTDVAPSDFMIKRVALQSANTSFGPALKTENWYESKDLYKRSRPRAIIALFDGLVQYRDGLEFSTKLALQPGTRATSRQARTIEHLCPQTFMGSNEWMRNLEDWEVTPEEMESRLHSIGNLTVLPQTINSTWQRSTAARKRAEFETDRFPSLKINREFTESEIWGPVQIDARTAALVEDALKFWKVPEESLFG